MTKDDILMVQMPFKKFGLMYEKNVPFLFRIMTLELTSDELGLDFFDLFDKKNVGTYDVSLSILWQAYLSACMVLKKKPKYKHSNAVVWHEYMSVKSRDLYLKGVTELLGKLKKSAEKPKEGEEPKKE
jgi:hypothetical protein